MNNKSNYLKILIDVPNIIRDGYGLVYLKLLLKRKGYAVTLASSEKLTIFTLFKYLPEIVILPQVEEIKGASIASYTKFLKGKVILLPTEGAAYPKTPEDVGKYFSRKYTKDYNAVIDLTLSWTEGFKGAFIKYAGVDGEKIKVVGCPRFDFYKEPLIKALMSKYELCKKYRLNVNNKIVTLATHYTFADVDIEHAKKHIAHVESYEYLKRRHKMEKLVRERVIKNFVKLAKELKNVNFIIKIHPWEDIQDYIKLTQRIPNIILIKNEYIGHVLKNSDVWLHVDCTTAKEATIMGKPVISLKFWKDEYEYTDDFPFLCDMAENYVELKEKVLYYLEGNRPKLSSGMMKRIEERFGKIDGKATERCVKEIAKFVESNRIKPTKKLPLTSEIIKNIIRYDLYVLTKNLVYSNKYLRNTYLRLRWKKSKEYLNYLEKEIYSKDFNLYINEIEERIKAVIK